MSSPVTFYVVLCGSGSDTTELSEIGGVFTSRSLAEAAIAEVRREQQEYEDFCRRWRAKENALKAALEAAGNWTGWWGDFPEHAAMYEAMEGRKEYPGRREMEVIEVGGPDVWVLS